jgi:DNA-3-methyladenine glycosylase
MFLEPHRAYVYRIYGTAWCFNITSEPAGVGAAVLVRALEPLEGIELMERRRGIAVLRDLCRGPGRLCTALAIDSSLDGAALVPGGPLELIPAAAQERIGRSVRIGITKAADRRLRFYLRGSPFLSGPRSLSP